MSAFTSGPQVAPRFLSALAAILNWRSDGLQQQGCCEAFRHLICTNATPGRLGDEHQPKCGCDGLRGGGRHGSLPSASTPSRRRFPAPQDFETRFRIRLLVRAFANYDVNTSSVEQARPPGPTHASPGPSRRSTRPRSRGRMPRGPAARTESYRRRAPAAASSRLVWSACLTPREAPARFVLPRRRRIPRSVAAAAARGRRATRPPAAAAVLLVSSRHHPRRMPALASSRRTSGSAGPCAAEAAWTAATPFSRPRRGPLARRTG